MNCSCCKLKLNLAFYCVLLLRKSKEARVVNLSCCFWKVRSYKYVDFSVGHLLVVLFSSLHFQVETWASKAFTNKQMCYVLKELLLSKFWIVSDPALICGLFINQCDITLDGDLECIVLLDLKWLRGLWICLVFLMMWSF